MKTTTSMNTICEVLERRRKERGISCAELARRVGWNGKCLNNALHRRQGIKADKFVLLCHELGLEVEDFIEEEESCNRQR